MATLGTYLNPHTIIRMGASRFTVTSTFGGQTAEVDLYRHTPVVHVEATDGPAHTVKRNVVFKSASDADLSELAAHLCALHDIRGKAPSKRQRHHHPHRAKRQQKAA